MKLPSYDPSTETNTINIPGDWPSLADRSVSLLTIGSINFLRAKEICPAGYRIQRGPCGYMRYPKRRGTFVFIKETPDMPCPVFSNPFPVRKATP